MSRFDEVAPRRGAGDDDFACAERLRQIRRRRYRELRFTCKCGRERPRLVCILIVGIDARRAAHPQQRTQLRDRLGAAAADQCGFACFARQVLRRDGGRGGRAQSRERH
jgi:hypothetical protein